MTSPGPGSASPSTATICLRPGRLLTPKTIAELREHKPALLAEMRRRSAPAQLSLDGKRCTICGRIARAYDAGRGGWTCSRCAEWEIEGCVHFTVLDDADDVAEARFGACLSCGASYALHGNPDPASWRRLSNRDDVQFVEVRYVLAAATAIVRGSP